MKYEPTPEGQYKRWNAEFEASEKFFRKWRKQGTKVVDKFLDERTAEEIQTADMQSRMNLFYSNVVTLQSMLYGSLPKVEVARTFQDADDDVARVAGRMIDRMLNQDIQDPGSDFVSVLHNVLQDRLLPGMGTARLRYRYETDVVDIPEQRTPEGIVISPASQQEMITAEWVETVYVHWMDYMYSPARTYDEVRWKAYRAYMDKEEAEARFGKEIAAKLPYKVFSQSQKDDSNPQREEYCQEQAEIWEIWCKTERKVYWYCQGYDRILEEEEDTLELNSFFPDPPPLVANCTTRKFIPKADYTLAQDLYTEIDRLQTRISILTDACKLVGVYDKQNEGVKRIFQEGVENDLIPVDNWAMFSEKGGLAGVIDWVPIEAVVKTIDVLTQKQGEKIQQLYEVTGLADILRGASQPYEAAATTKAKSQFASIRVQRIQDEFAKFAGDLQALKTEIIQRHFQPQSIIQQSNIQYTQDAEYAEPAVQLIKNPDVFKWRISIRPESLAQADYAQLKADRIDYINGLAMFLQSSAPILELDQDIAPAMLELLKWGLAGFKGSNEIEGVLDRAIKMYTDKQKQPKPEKPDPEIIKIQAEMQLEQQKHQFKMQEEMARIENERREFEQKMQMDMMKFQADIQRDREKHQLEMAQLREKHALEIAKMQGKLIVDSATAEIKMETQEHAAKIQMERDNSKARGDKD
jgi:hypothetical protein